MERRAWREREHVGLATACAIVYSKLTGHIPDPKDAAVMHATLNDVAHALSNLVAVYGPDPGTGVPEPLKPLDLIEGEFLRGAQVFRTKRGDELRGLTIRRGDIENAIKVLLAAQIRFRNRGKD